MKIYIKSLNRYWNLKKFAYNIVSLVYYISGFVGLIYISTEILKKLFYI